jgi:hypothetical protein
VIDDNKIKMQNDHGQLVIIFLLAIAIVLAIGLSVAGRSVKEVANTTKVEQSSRAFFAAESGLEKALNQNISSSTNYNLDNSTQVNVIPGPQQPSAGQALEYPPIPKEQTAHFWLVDATDITHPYYNDTFIDVYYGRQGVSDDDLPALRLSFVYVEGNAYKTKSYYLDSSTNRRAQNNFPTPGAGSSPYFDQLDCNGYTINSNFSINTTVNDRKFLCHARLGDLPKSATSWPLLVRVRLLYSSVPQQVALKPSAGAAIPPQARIFTSKATVVGSDVQRVLQIFKIDYVVPQMFDFSIFAKGVITK